MAVTKYITLKTSDDTTRVKYFRVIAQDYDDGTPNRAETVRRQIGGGIDHSLGKVYRTWSMMIRVRHTESESGYGTLADLEYFYNLNNPAATPSTTIHFVDHHGTAFNVQLVGQMPKQAMGVMIEGSDAWYIYRVQLMEE